MLVGEAPGQKEEEQRSPFVGPAGELLDRIMKAIGLSTERDMFITNCVLCRPASPRYSGKQNYTPKKEQLNQCWPFLEKQIQILKPKILIACGATAMKQLMGDDTQRMGPWEGKWTWYTRFGDNNQEIPMFVMTHPAAILHKAPWPEDQRKAKIKVWKYMREFEATWKSKILKN
jgi:DNA polymerase